MKYIVHNQEGKEVGTALLPKEIFEVAINHDLIHEVAIAQMGNKRKVAAHTKTRSEVSGGGRKPWKQKGTGRARHGSTRSPLWRKGGITFGPRNERVFEKKINKKTRIKALMMVLSAKAKEKLIVLLDNLNVEQPKTKLMARIIRDIGKKSMLIALPSIDENIRRSAKNLPGIEVVEARNLNCLELLSSKYLLMPKESIKSIKETFLKSQTALDDKENL